MRTAWESACGKHACCKHLAKRLQVCSDFSCHRFSHFIFAGVCASGCSLCAGHTCLVSALLVICSDDGSFMRSAARLVSDSLTTRAWSVPSLRAQCLSVSTRAPICRNVLRTPTALRTRLSACLALHRLRTRMSCRRQSPPAKVRARFLCLQVTLVQIVAGCGYGCASCDSTTNCLNCAPGYWLDVGGSIYGTSSGSCVRAFRVQRLLFADFGLF